MKGVKLTPSHRIYGLGAILLVSLLICSRNFTRMGDPSFLVPLAVASIAYLLVTSEFFSTPRFPRRVIVAGLELVGSSFHVNQNCIRPGFSRADYQSELPRAIALLFGPRC